jgi:deoxyribonuclease-4
MLPNGRRLGAHLPLGNGMVKAADRAAEIGASALQIFTDNPASWRRRPNPPPELPAFRDRLAAHGIAPLVIHAPYLVNLASPIDEIHERSIELLAHELRVAEAYGASAVNVHVGSHRGEGAAQGLAAFSEGASAALAAAAGDAPDVVLVIENGSGVGHGLGTTMDELAAIDKGLVAQGVDRARFGFCLDVAHLWGAGYAVDTVAGVDSAIDAFDAAVGLDRLRLVHLNDSRSELGSRSDRHEHIGAGRIGGVGIGRFVAHPRLDGVTYLLETPGMDEGWDGVNLDRVRDLAAGRPLAELPAEAFKTRSAKGRSAPAEDAVPVDGP